MPHPVFSASSTALITGGASGIGLAIAQQCAKHGMKLAIADVNPETLATAKSSFDQGAEVETYNVDVSQVDSWKKLRVEVGKRFGGVNLLVLNAGVGPKSDWEDIGSFHKIFDTNVFGVLNGISTFLPVVKTQAETHPTAIVLTGSKQGITNPPGNPAYNASKSAIKTLAEHLSFDLRATSTSVHLLVPGWTFTGLTGGGAAATKQKPPGAWEPRQVAEYLMRAMDEKKFYVICPDNDVTEDLDRKRVLWGAGDLVQGRPPLSRWREDWKETAQKGIEETVLPEKTKKD